MAIGGDAVRDTASDKPRRAKEVFCCRFVPLLTQQDIDEVSLAIYRAVEIGPASFHFDIRLVDIPARADVSSSVLAQHFTQHRGELRFPLSDGFMRKDQAPLEEHFREIAQ